jgi:hypothetical protein
MFKRRAQTPVVPAATFVVSAKLSDHAALRNAAGDDLNSITFTLTELTQRTPTCDTELRDWVSFISDVNEYLLDEYDTEFEKRLEDLVVDTFVAATELAHHAHEQLQNQDVQRGTSSRLLIAHEASHDCTTACYENVVFSLRYQDNYNLSCFAARIYSVRYQEEGLCIASAPRWMFDSIKDASSDKEGSSFCVDAPTDSRSYALLVSLSETMGVKEAHEALYALLS